MQRESNRHKKQLGKTGEERAERFLKSQGYKIIERNFKPPRWGEIDLIAVDGDTLVFIEVKTRKGDSMIAPYRAVDGKKLEVLKRAALYYTRTHKNLPEALRIDVVSVHFPNWSNKAEVELFKNIA